MKKILLIIASVLMLTTALLAFTACDEEVAVDPCTKGQHTYYDACDTDCNTCGQTRTAAEHKWDEGKVTKEPTTSEKGEVTFTCTECGKTKTEETPVLPSGGCGGGTDEGTLVAVISSGTILLVWFVFKKKIFNA